MYDEASDFQHHRSEINAVLAVLQGIGMPLPEAIPDRAETIARYEQISGHQVRDIDYYEVFAGMRFAGLRL